MASIDTGMRGRVESIHLAPVAGAPMRAVERARAIAGQGLEGDRYALGLGHWSPIHRAGDRLTLVELEVLVEPNTTYEFGLRPGATPRNLTTSGIRLDDLIGRRFRVGEVVFRAVRRCEPCSYLEGLIGQEVLYPLVHKGGIRVEILESGAIAVGDQIEALAD